MRAGSSLFIVAASAVLERGEQCGGGISGLLQILLEGRKIITGKSVLSGEIIIVVTASKPMATASMLVSTASAVVTVG